MSTISFYTSIKMKVINCNTIKMILKLIHDIKSDILYRRGLNNIF